MHIKTSQNILENDKLLHHFIEHSYWVKELNRNPLAINHFQKQMKVIYKERPSDKINNALDSVEMISTLLDTLN